MSDLIRLARSLYGENYGRLASEAGRIRADYVSQGGDPEDVYSPERVAALSNGGPLALLREQSKVRPDGSVAAPYLPTELALATGIIEPRAIPAVRAATSSGLHTVSSGTDRRTGLGFAIGEDPNGNIVKLLR